MKGDYLLLALRNLRHRGIRSWLTLLGILIGVAAVVSLISLSNGLKVAVVSQFGVSNTEVISIQAGGIDIGPPGSGVVTPLTEGDAEAIDKLSEIDVAFGEIIGTVKTEFNDKVSFVYIASVPNGDVKKESWEISGIEIEYGRLLTDSDSGKVVLGSNFYTDTEKFDKRISVGDKVLIEDEKFEVVGITKKEGSLIYDNLIWMNEDVLRDLLDYGEKVDVISAKVKDKDEMDRAKEAIEKLMRNRRDVKKGEEDFVVSTPESTLEAVNSVLNGIQAFIVVIASVSILVGAIGIVNTMTTSVLERRKEIGIMKSIGAKNSQIFLQFLIESGLLGLVGGIVGTLVGIGVGYLGTIGINGYIGSEMSPSVNLFLIFGALLGSFVIGAVSGIAPAMKAANQNPVEALRG